DFEPKDHVELGKLLGAIDTERGAKVAGARSYYLTGAGAMLELALVNYAISQATEAGFIPVIPPVLVNPAAMEGTGFLGQAAENVYHIEKDDVYLVGTSEVPLAAYHLDETIEAVKLPLRYTGYSPCFRREAGSYGKDTRGIIRVHQFEKVEMFIFCKPEDAKAEHQRLLQWEKDFLNAMELPYRVIDIASGDLGSSANRKFDIEAWIPTQNAYREVTSTSNCTEFQARRLNIRLKDENGTRPLATLNGTLVAVPRMIVAILENNQNADGSVNVPKALQPFIGKEKFEVI
ncbi:MAG: serine--tRNA ligase, partial [Candidatus Nanopelagicaceae bacterium]